MDRQPGDKGICHGLGDSNNRHRQSGKKIGFDETPAIATDPGNKGNEIFDMDVHR